MNMWNNKSSDQLRNFTEMVIRFNKEVLVKASTASKIVKTEVTCMYEWARKIMVVCNGNEYLSRQICEALMLTEFHAFRPMDAGKVLTMRILNNIWLPKETLDDALEHFERLQGFKDTEARCAIRQRNEMRKHIIALAEINAELGEDMPDVLKALANQSMCQRPLSLISLCRLLVSKAVSEEWALQNISSQLGDSECAPILDEIEKNKRDSMFVNAVKNYARLAKKLLEMCTEPGDEIKKAKLAQWIIRSVSQKQLQALNPSLQKQLQMLIMQDKENS